MTATASKPRKATRPATARTSPDWSDVAQWINDREPSRNLAEPLPALYANVRLGAEGDHCGSYSSLASIAQYMSRDADDLREASVRFIETKGLGDMLRRLDRIADICGASTLLIWGAEVARLVESLGSEPAETHLSEMMSYAALGHYINER